jgi:tRNA-uridine 2-sulfurtransferase
LLVLTGKKPKVLVAMSGGVDSSVAAAILRDQGYDLIGCFMRLGSPGESLEESCETGGAKIGHQGCCSVGDAADAKLVAARLDIPFYVCNFKEDFGRIIDYFVDEYAAGRTPNPCVRCNDWLKFGRLREFAEQLGCDLVASGHYARICEIDGRARLLRGVDMGKDQSYVLFGAPSEELARTLLPIGEMQKSRVREMARELNLPVFDKPDSQEICFVPDNNYAGLVERKRPETARPGAILNDDGNEIGEHPGQHRFTIGQRRGVGMAFGHPIYVIDKNAEDNTVTVGSRESLKAAGCTASETNWHGAPGDDWYECLAQHRYNSTPVPARVKVLDDAASPGHGDRSGRFEVLFDAPEQAVTPGQAIVLYERTRPEVVLGGGWIDTVERAEQV